MPDCGHAIRQGVSFRSVRGFDLPNPKSIIRVVTDKYIYNILYRQCICYVQSLECRKCFPQSVLKARYTMCFKCICACKAEPTHSIKISINEIFTVCLNPYQKI